MKCFKGFDKDLRCKDFKYEVGKEYETERAEICEEGFHACEFPLDVLRYYDPADSRFCEVELAANEQTHDDSKRVGKKIKIGAEIGLSGLIKAGVKFILEKADFENDNATNTGDWSAATNTGNWSAATNTGDWSAATNTGNWSAATVEGKESIAIVTGNGSKARGKRGCWLVLTERDKGNHVLGVQAVKVDGETIKEDVFYTLSGGKVTEVKKKTAERELQSSFGGKDKCVYGDYTTGEEKKQDGQEVRAYCRAVREERAEERIYRAETFEHLSAGMDF